MRVDANGNVGIGANPSTALHVVGITRIQPPGTQPGNVATIQLFSTFENTADNIPRYTSRITAGYNGGAWGNEYLAIGVGRGGQNDASLDPLERIRIAGGGNVGIGTTNPLAKLHVIGSLLISPLGTQTDPITMVSDLYGKAAGNYFVRWNNGNVTLNEWDGLWLKVHDEGLNANLFTSYWSEGTVTSMTNFGGFGLGYGHGWPIQTVWALKSSDVQNNTLTINNLPKHSFIRYFVRWHSVDSIDNEFNELRIFDIYKVNQFNAMWNSTRQSNISFNTNNVFLNTSSTWTTAEYSYRPWSTGNGTSIIHGYFTIDTNTQVHTTSQFKALHFSGTDQGQEDEAVYYTHSTLYLR